MFLLTSSVALADPSFRPTLSGPDHPIDVDRFRVHWTDTGGDAVVPTDADGNGRPDLLDLVLATLPVARESYEEEGWRSLVGDDGTGGSAAMDVYVRQLDYYGLTYSTAGPDGTSCYLQFDSHLNVLGGVGASVVTHELHHCVEFRYTTRLGGWIYEAAATYEQYTHVIDPSLTLPLGILYEERLRAPDRRLAAFDGRFEYSGFLWMKYWSEREGADAESNGFHPERLPALWDVLARASDWKTGLDRAGRQAFGTDLPTTFLQFAEWNSFACGGDDGQHYLPDVLPCVVDYTVPAEPWDGAPVDLVQDDAPYTAAYLDLDPTTARVGVRCDGVDGLVVGLVPLDPDGVAEPATNGPGGSLIVADGAGGPIRVVVASTETAMDATCQEVAVPQPVAARIGSGGEGCAQSPAPGGLLPLLAWLPAVRRLARRSGRAPGPR